MECPNCTEQAEILEILPPTKHLEGGSTIEWCPACGTVFRYSDFSDKKRNIRIPKVSKHEKARAQAWRYCNIQR